MLFSFNVEMPFWLLHCFSAFPSFILQYFLLLFFTLKIMLLDLNLMAVNFTLIKFQPLIFNFQMPQNQPTFLRLHLTMFIIIIFSSFIFLSLLSSSSSSNFDNMNCKCWVENIFFTSLENDTFQFNKKSISSCSKKCWSSWI